MDGVIRYTAEDALTSGKSGFWVHASDLNQKVEQAKQREVALQDRLTECDERLDAQRLRADTAEAELDAVKQALDATRDALEAAKYAKGELTTRLSEHEQLFYDLTHSPHAVAVPLELWNRIEVFADAALNQKSEGES